MYIINGVAYAGRPKEELQVTAVKALPDMMMLVTFDSGETRLYDASGLLAYPAFAPLAEEQVFMNPTIEHGLVTWQDGEIDIAPEAMYRDSYAYERLA